MCVPPVDLGERERESDSIIVDIIPLSLVFTEKKKSSLCMQCDSIENLFPRDPKSVRTLL